MRRSLWSGTGPAVHGPGSGSPAALGAPRLVPGREHRFLRRRGRPGVPQGPSLAAGPRRGRPGPHRAGEPLLASHGFPLRAVAPRMFGTNPAKWLTRIHLADTRRTPPSEDAPSPVREVAHGVVRPDVDIRPAATLAAAPLPPAGGT
ncbi:molybdopterin-dependent oxidoreductase [Streptomyces sp. NPDC085866]|uniref:molybdopterin-dependent oxidoreductase n=1 Tax=Streptomyces sp. NPDC085866 TaxID=3365736 RepID=UPI0037D85221